MTPNSLWIGIAIGVKALNDADRPVPDGLEHRKLASGAANSSERRNAGESWYIEIVENGARGGKHGRVRANLRNVRSCEMRLVKRDLTTLTATVYVLSATDICRNVFGLKLTLKRAATRIAFRISGLRRRAWQCSANTSKSAALPPLDPALGGCF
jgi:hypothetical protein